MFLTQDVSYSSWTFRTQSLDVTFPMSGRYVSKGWLFRTLVWLFRTQIYFSFPAVDLFVSYANIYHLVIFVMDLPFPTT